ncbi:MAG: ABC transporter ATP-binding protein [Fibrobacter sp.]|nr:ABC transporter ATP-binding protein [Fibrobacter sp.]
MNTFLIQAENLRFGYDRALNTGFSFELPAGELIAVAGPNGSGKTTFLKTLAGLISPYSGSLLLCGKEIREWRLKERARRISIQFATQTVPPLMTVYEVVSLGRTPYADIWDSRTEEDAQIINKVLKQTNTAEFAGREIASLSDGERSRAFLARSLAQCAKVILLDEPSAFLDIPHTVNLFRLLKTIVQEEKISFVLTTHNLEMAFRFSDRILCFDGNGGIHLGKPLELKEKGCFSWAEI